MLKTTRPTKPLPPSSQISIAEIRDAANALRVLTAPEFTQAAQDLRTSLAAGQTDNTNQIFAFAAEAVRRSTGKQYYDVQLQAGSVLANGDLAEMATGEGKTLVTLLPVFASVCRGQNVHVSTANSYLAERDCAELRDAFELLGVSIGLLPEDNDEAAKRTAYSCDVTYGTGYEFGFDYLRDQLLLRQQPADRLGEAWIRSLTNSEKTAAPLVQSDRHVSFIDEIDSVLIDEANTPLVISFFASETVDERPFRLAASTALALQEESDYRIDKAQNRITITQPGMHRIERDQPRSADMHLKRPWRIYVEQALRAHHLLRRDIDYVLQENKVALVDQQTGRIFPERKWRDGLHQAIEFREGAKMTPETNSFARISRQRFFGLYDHGTGMTGTAIDAADELRSFFNLKVVPIPLHRKSQRITLPARFFADKDSKYAAIAKETAFRHLAGQPVLIGTRTIEQSLEISAALDSLRLEHQVLNGIQDADEAAIVADAGRSGCITVATNMAGRGTDISLSTKSRQAGGLHVIVTEPNRSFRVDRQLVGRCGRQGDPGSCQIFTAADDELLVHVGKSLASEIVRRADTSGEAKFDRGQQLRAVQRQAEQIDFARRQHLMQQDLWVDGILNTLVGHG